MGVSINIDPGCPDKIFSQSKLIMGVSINILKVSVMKRMNAFELIERNTLFFIH